MSVFKELFDKLDNIQQEIELAEETLRKAPMVIPYSETYEVTSPSPEYKRDITLQWERLGPEKTWRICTWKRTETGLEGRFTPLVDNPIKTRLLIAPFIQKFVDHAETVVKRYLAIGEVTNEGD